MNLHPLPKLMEDKFDKDALVYIDDSHFYYNSGVDKRIIEDITNKTLQI